MTTSDSHVPTRLHAFVIAWSGTEDQARRIARALDGAVDDLTVIYSNHEGRDECGRGDWVKVPDEWFYGMKFRHSLALNTGDIMLHITADAGCEDWPGLAQRCRDMHADFPKLAIWSPDIDHTDWLLELVSLGRLENQDLVEVVQTDSIVWSMTRQLLQRMNGLDYECNNFGWGIDWFAISHSYGKGLKVVRDLAVKVSHPRGMGYCKQQAEKQMWEFFKQMDRCENRHLKRLMKHLESRAQHGLRGMFGRFVRSLPGITGGHD